MSNKTNNIKATFEHVYGHQDDKVAKEDLPLPARLNVECDELAEGTFNTMESVYQGVLALLGDRVQNLIQKSIKPRPEHEIFFRRI